jgi:hypothetical protein
MTGNPFPCVSADLAGHGSLFDLMTWRRWVDYGRIGSTLCRCRRTTP